LPPRRDDFAAGLDRGFGATWLRAVRIAVITGKSSPWGVSILFATTVLSGICPVIVALLTRAIIDTLAGGGRHAPRTELELVVLAMVAAGLAGTVLPQVLSLVEVRIEQALTLLIQGRLFGFINQSPGIRQFEDPAYQDRLQLAQQAGPQAPSQLLQLGFTMLQSGITLVGFLAALLVLGWQLCAIVAASAVPSVIMQFRLNAVRGQTNWENAGRVRKQFFYSGLQSDPQVAREIRVFGFGDFLLERMQSALREINRSSLAIATRTMRVQVLGGALTGVVAGIGMVYVVLQVAAGKMSVGDVTLFIAAAAGLQSGLSGLLQAFVQAQQALLGYAHYEALLSRPPEIAVASSPLPVAELRSGIEFRDVWFRYDDGSPWVLRGVDLEIPAKRTTALVGLNGGGKSTLVKLMCRFYDPTRGAVLWDGIDLRAFDPAVLRRKLSVVFQDFGCYELTARENIALPDITQAENGQRINSAAQVGDVHRALTHLPQGYETFLSRIFFAGETEGAEHGVRLSGGQWQRLAIARAAFRSDCEVLVLDEFSSGLDPEAERAIADNLRAFSVGRTCLVISHRLSSVKDANQIAVVSDGRISEQGRHADLIGLAAEYARLWELQSSPFATARAGEA